MVHVPRSQALLAAFILVQLNQSLAWVQRFTTTKRMSSIRKSSELSDEQTRFWKGCSPMKSFDLYKHGPVPSYEGLYWRQNSDTVEVWAAIDDSCKVKRDVKVDLGPKRLAISLKNGAPSFDYTLQLSNGVDVEECTWMVEADETPGPGDDRWLLVTLKKSNKYFNWQSLDQMEAQESSRLTIGLSGDHQAIEYDQQISFVRLTKVGQSTKCDVYARSLSSKEDNPYCYFVGKVAAVPEVAIKEAVWAQAPLISRHAKKMHKEVFGEELADVELLTAPGDSEMGVAQEQISLQPLAKTLAKAIPTSAQEVGFDPETIVQGQEPFRVRRSPEGAPLGPPVQANFVSPERASEFDLSGDARG